MERVEYSSFVCHFEGVKKDEQAKHFADAPEYRIERSDACCRLILEGCWCFEQGLPDAEGVFPVFSKLGAGGSLCFETGGITGWDSGLMIYLLAVRKAAQNAGVTLDDTGLPMGVQRLLALTAAVPERPGTSSSGVRESVLRRLGDIGIGWWDGFMQTVRFVGEVVAAAGRFFRGKARYRQTDLWLIIQDCGAEALPIVTLISLLVGVILAFMGAVQLQLFGAGIYVADLVAIGMLREMGALMAGIIMAGRTGASYAARLGTMQVNEEIDALVTMGFSPMEFLVLPRMIAMILMMPLLCVYADFLGIIGGAIVGVTMLDLTPVQYYLQTVGAVDLHSVLAGLLKSVVFGVLVAIAGCMQGIRCGRSASAVGDATTKAVVSAIVYIIVADSLITVLYTVVGF